MRASHSRAQITATTRSTSSASACAAPSLADRELARHAPIVFSDSYSQSHFCLHFHFHFLTLTLTSTFTFILNSFPLAFPTLLPLIPPSTLLTFTPLAALPASFLSQPPSMSPSAISAYPSKSSRKRTPQLYENQPISTTIRTTALPPCTMIPSCSFPPVCPTHYQ